MIIYDSADNILNTLRRWELEMNSPYNDGWVREGFREKLFKVKGFFAPRHLDEALKSLPEGGSLKAWEDELELYETYGGD
jgi:hypothetical protein